MRNNRTGDCRCALYELDPRPDWSGDFFSAGKFSSALAVSNPIPAAVFVALFLAALAIYARFRICFERNRTVLLCALRHIKMVQAKLSKSS